jgi:hypothetical protein
VKQGEEKKRKKRENKINKEWRKKGYQKRVKIEN